MRQYKTHLRKITSVHAKLAGMHGSRRPENHLPSREQDPFIPRDTGNSLSMYADRMSTAGQKT